MSRRVAQPIDSERKTAAIVAGPRWSKLARALEGMYPFMSVEPGTRGDDPEPLVAIQVTTRCNQRCPFCQAPEPGAMSDPSAEVLLRAFARVASALPDAKLILTGGEPCLRPDLPALVEHLLADDRVGQVELQTNAVQLGQGPAGLRFAPSSRLLFVVAMHALRDEVYDTCTGTTGLLPRALAGVQALLEAGHRVEFNCVATRLNIDHLEDYLERLSAIFAGPQRPAVHFSIMGVPEHRDAADLLVPFGHLLSALARARAKAEQARLESRVSLSAGHAAVPACLLDPDAPLDSRSPTEYQHEGACDEADGWWVQGPDCRACSLYQRCLGLPRAYAERFGFDELEPIGNAKP